MWRVETTHKVDTPGAAPGVSPLKGFVDVAELTEPAIVAALRETYKGIPSDAAVTLSHVIARTVAS